MQTFSAGWLASEHYRLHLIEQWPESPRKQAVIEAIQSTLDSLSRLARRADENFVCVVCETKKMKSKLLEMPPNREPAPISDLSIALERTG
jgi:hypothetical protein